ncbi:MAG: S1 RNA-binding domain-containing protein, partial [Alphaproteobacteria bacterium]|nr:S1 RNA-binding domain-containing protein [Alphaproteobacteria bacterium]
MTKRLLIDATHTEETRVIIADDQRIHEFDISATTKTQNKGNIYLAKVTRVEPSLQAAFVEYGGGRQGFLPFSEIHPDYYQIPVADRKRLLEEVAQEFEKAQAEEEERDTPRPEREENGERGERGERDRNGRRGRGRRRGRNRGRERGDRPENAEPQLDENGNPIPVELDAAFDGENDFRDESIVSSETVSEEPIPVDAVISDAVDTDVLKGSEEAEAVAAEAKEEEEIAAGHAALNDEGRSIPAAAAEPEVAKSDIIEEAELLPEATAEAASDTSSDTPVAHDIRSAEEGEEGAQPRRERTERGDRHEKGEKPHQEDIVETTGQGDGLADEDDFTRRRKANFLRHYKIQEVIKKNQVILVQVIKEERGNKGASLSTYISLAGRYCVLMPNSPKTGGISRKISSSEDRKRLKEISEDMRTENGMSAIIRTAGIDRTRAEIKRDFDYLLKLWDNIRELTLSSTAPAIVHEEADIIKRSLRDLYSSDIKDIVVSGEEAHKRAKEFMKIMMPSHAARIKLHNESTPIF